MTSKELTRKLYLRLSKLKWLIVIAGVLLAAALYMYSKTKPVVYTAFSSVYPLTAANDNSSGNLLSTLMGQADAPKSFSQEASINIVELALSRTTRETVAMERLSKFGNKTIAQLLIESFNKSRSRFTPAIKIPTDDTTLRNIGGNILKDGITAKINKNGILEITFSDTDEKILSPVSYVFIDKISQFYKDLKVKKARFDYNFTVRKMDSLQSVLNTYDRRAIQMANTTRFVPGERIEFTIPKENLISDKERVLNQRNASANNREEALWRLQKVTPIIETLDKPDPPFTQKRPSATLYAFIGFMLGCFLGALLSVAGILYKYINAEIRDAILGDEVVVDNTTTTTALL
ncbi:MAG: hypothetical protein JWQ27_1196 [Ferruginibacter sp.]|nr:hypothetical protein [Ferruginibacter sp.]